MMLRATVLAFFVLAAAGNDARPERKTASDSEILPAGIAILSSSIGKEVSQQEVMAFVKACRINLVVIDFAWITHHWPSTDLAAVERLASDLRAAKVTVAAMYRPRGLSPQDARVHWAQGPDGTVPDDHNHLCFAHADSVEWGVDWGRKILTACPSVDRIILYNVLAPCQCEKCRQDNGARHAEAFVQTCCREWRKLRPAVKIGHVGMAAEYAGSVDFLCPFFSLNRENAKTPVDTPALASQVKTLQKSMGEKPVIPLIKVCWEDETRNDTSDVIHAIRDCQRDGTGFILWYYEWLFHSSAGRYDAPLVLASLGGHWDQVRGFYAATAPFAPQSSGVQEKEGSVQEEEAREAKSPDDDYHFVSPYEGFLSAESRSLGLKCIRREAVLVCYSDQKKQLAEQVADVLEKMHGEARRIAGFPISVHGLILLKSLDELPSHKRSQWLNVDGIACLVRVLGEQSLPLKSDLDNHMVFALLIHESVDVGIKETIFTRYPQTMDWRWWLEGLADHCSHQACRKHQKGAFGFARDGYSEKLNSLSDPSIDLLAPTTWFPKGYTDPGDVNHAYAASHYVISRLAQQHGEKWIGEALRRYRADLEKNPNPDFLAIVKSLTGDDVKELVGDVKVKDVKQFAASLDGVSGRSQRQP
jgi:hypothetical protein